ncbi:GerAB/ArcD/ProY family transporter [Virgibacillus halophilus]|uniref:GerAB/ArcD/ProY family transporter n=1 Tax=Tigheibacillus halophilus TaxID=361280 RepID=A0ABU5C9S1_9BACI|nr:GerAB/ArcD/ProY family transporter [Virgibacillus halophilus]
MEINNLLPVFQTDWQDYIKAMPSGITSYIGFGIIWFYISLVQKPQKLGRKVAKVMCIPIGVYLLVYLACVGVFGNMVTSNLVYPVVELAKEAELPGGIFERFESLFFVVWVMAIFNTTAMAFDIAVYALNMLFKKVDKHKFVFALAPIIFIISMTPHNTESVRLFATGLSYFAFSFSLLTLILFAIAIKVKGVKGNG